MFPKFLNLSSTFVIKTCLQMSGKHVISFSAIAEFFKDDTSQLKRGENSYESGNVMKMVFDAEVSPALLKGEVRASMKKKNYTVQISIDFDDGIVDSKCSCPRGLVACHHMAALCIYAHHNVSVTDKSCAWNRPKQQHDDVVSRIKDIYQPKRLNYMAVERMASSSEIDNFKTQLGYSIPVGFTWLLMSDPSDETNLLPSIEDIIFCQEYANVIDKETYFKEKVKVTKDIIHKVHQLTIGQSSNEIWLIARKHRLTSSKFGPVISAYKRNKFPKSLFKDLLEGYNLSGVQAVQWGRENESTAIKQFQEITGLIVEPSGFCLDACGFLGTSPDGYVSLRCLLEVKCPFKYRNEKDLKEMLRKDKSYVIFIDDDNTVVVNENHNYYHQIQGELHITGRDMCYLFLWIPNDYLIVHIARNDEWKENLDLLRMFYLQKFLPCIFSN